MSATVDRERFARIALSFVAEPGDLTLGAVLTWLTNLGSWLTQRSDLRVLGS